MTVTNTPTTTVTVVVPPSATADCPYWIAEFSYLFEVYNIVGWSTDGGKKLKDLEKGCGALTGWDWDERTSTHLSRAYFNLPFLHEDFTFGKRSMEIGPPPPPPRRRRQLISETASLPSRSPVTESYTRSETAPLYTLESWGPGNTEIFTTTIKETSKSTYTTEIVLGTMKRRRREHQRQPRPPPSHQTHRIPPLTVSAVPRTADKT
ncbi:hypothetical protein BDW75DRAFT_237434 [Aspergillus navahoensis]